MYGLVNQAIKDLVTKQFGEEPWKKICDETKISTDDFVSLQYYPDPLTYQLVGSASKVLNLPANAILYEFGKYWVLYTAREGYGSLMDLFGHDYKSCLENLNNLHARMGMTMPNLSPPRFQFTEVSPTQYVLEYFSKRAGLCPMVEGLLMGLAEKHNKKVKIQLDAEATTSGRNIFNIQILE